MHFRGNPESKGNGNFLRLKDGEAVQGTFVGDPFEFYSKWENGKSHVCPEGEDGARFRFRINFVLRENGALVSKIWEQGPTVYRALKDLHQEYNLEETIVNVKRTGSDMNNTVYTVMPAKKSQLAPEMVAQVKAVPLQDLARGLKDEATFDPKDFGR